MPTAVRKSKQTHWQAKGAASNATAGILRRVAALPPVRAQDRTKMLDAIASVRLLEDDEAGAE